VRYNIAMSRALPALNEFITLADFPAVISGAHIRELRENPKSPRTHDFVSGYLGFDSRSLYALNESISALAEPQRGRAFWLNGVYGSGKSHFLGLMALLCDQTGHQIFAKNFSQFEAALGRFTPRLVVSIALDDYSAAKFGLEEIFWRELEAQLKREALPPLEIDRTGSRAESLTSLQTFLETNGKTGLVVLFDELSLFLGGRRHRPLQDDAAFLQFLGQHAQRAPLWVFGALQKNIDDIGGLEPYSLGQIRDRYQILSLSLAHLPSLIERRLIVVKDEKRLFEWCHHSFEALQNTLPRLDFGPNDWRRSFPFHPATIGLLEAVTGRFFSRTRSAALFCAQSIDLASPATQRIGPESIWDYFAPEIVAHPDLRQLNEVADSWESLAETIAPDNAEIMRRAMKYLLVCKIAGQMPTAIHLANALELDANLDGEANYEWARQLLEKLRRNAPFLAVERAENSLFDRYTVDFGKRVGDMARRQVQSALETIPSGDPRLISEATRAAKADPLPLAQISQGRSYSIFWANSPRQIAVMLWEGDSLAAIANRVLAVRENGARDEAFLLILPPFARNEFDLIEFAKFLPDLAAKSAFWLWKPRAAARDEWELCRENAAATLCTQDPALLDNRRGRAILEHLERDAPARDHALSKITTRLYLEGEIALANGATLEASELTRADNFVGLLESIADFAFPQLFPHWASIAPRARMLTQSNADVLCLEILRRPLDEPYYAPSMERLCRHIAEPLGLAKSQSGRWKIGDGNAELNAQIKELLGINAENGKEGATYTSIEAVFARNKWGLPPSICALMVCGLIRSGEVVAFDSRGQELASNHIGLPLHRSLYYLRSGLLPESANWTKIAVLLKELVGAKIGAPSFNEKSKAVGLLDTWREETTRILEISRARSAQIRRQLQHETQSWSGFEECCQLLGHSLSELATPSPNEKLARAAALDVEAIKTAQQQFQRYAAALEACLPSILGIHGLLFAPDLVPPLEQSDERIELQNHLSSGESVLFDFDFLERAGRWRESYEAKYQEWHRTQNDPARTNSLRRLIQSDALRALERLALLHNRPFEEGPQIRGEIEEELTKICPRDGSIERGSATCSTCGLKLSQRLQLAGTADFESRIERALASFKSAIAENAPRDFLTRNQSQLLEWDGQSETLLPLLSPTTLRDLDSALAPRRQVSRSLAVLNEKLRGATTKREVETAFASWLAENEVLADDDEIIINQ
jgi:hypothetical protein